MAFQISILRGKSYFDCDRATSLPIRVFSCMVIPKTVLQRTDGLMASFLWSQSGQHRVHWVAWNKICPPFVEGGLGIRLMADMIYRLQGKIAWKIVA